MCAASSAETAATRTPSGAPTLVIGLGNPILGDDGAGWLVVDAVEAATPGDATIGFDWLAVGGLTLMERLVDARRAILVDTVVTGRDPVGTVRVLDLDLAPRRTAGHLDAAHDVGLADALEAGRALGAVLPDDITVVTIEVDRVVEFGETVTPPVAAAIPRAAERVLGLLAQA